MRFLGSDQGGFTLIELLVVVAIISILAALTFAIGPRIIESANLTDTQNRFNQLRVLLTDYYAQHGTYPPRYGYLVPDLPDEFPFALADIDSPNPPLLDVDHDFNIRPWMDYLGEHKNFDLYDNFATSGDTNGDAEIDLLEFSPLADSFTGMEDVYEDGAYAAGVRNLAPETAAQIAAETRPFIYIPVNKRQLRQISEKYFELANTVPPNINADLTDDDPRPDDDTVALQNDVLIALAAQERFPPARYDAYVLISVGPGVDTNELLYDFFTSAEDDANHRTARDTGPDEALYIDAEYRYHILGLITYFMVTRDANDNFELDFDFYARTRKDEGLVTVAPNTFSNRMPDTVTRNAAGPIIYVSE